MLSVKGRHLQQLIALSKSFVNTRKSIGPRKDLGKIMVSSFKSDEFV
jgi:hypothetical protein